MTDVSDTNNVLSVTLKMDDKVGTALRMHGDAEERAASYIIDSPDMAQLAATELKGMKDGVKEIDRLYDGFVEPAKQIIENARAFFIPTRQALERAIASLGSKLVTYQQEQDRIAEENRLKAEAEARRQRQEAEQRAAAERARAAVIAEENRKKAAEVEEARLKAEAEGNARAAASLAAESARLIEKADAVVENAEAKAATAVMEAAAAPVVAAPAKIAGLSLRKNWVAEIEPGKTEKDVIRAIAALLNERPELIALLSLDMTAAKKLAKAQEGEFNVPYMKARNAPIAASR